MFLFSIITAWAVPTAVPGTTVTLDPPAGFDLSPQFPGFTNGALGSIMVTELPVAATEMAAQLTKEAIASKGMKELERERQGTAVMILVEQTAGTTSVKKWMRIVGTDEKTALIVGTVGADDPNIEAVKQALNTVVLSDEASTPHPATLRFGITPAAGFATAGTFQTMQMFTLAGKPPPLPDDEPRFMVGPSTSPADLSNLESFAKARLQQLPFESPRDISISSVEISGRPGVELSAVATHPNSRVDRMIYQLIVPEADNTYFIAVGIGSGKKEWTAFQEMGRSLRLDLEAP